MFIKVNKINEDGKHVKNYDGKKMILWSSSLELGFPCCVIHEGDTLNVSKEKYNKLLENCGDFVEFEIVRPKYANYHVGTDVYPFEILEWKTDRKIVVRRLDESVDGDKFESNENNPTEIIREHKNGYFYRPNTNTCAFILSEKPYFYRDPCF